MKLLPVLWLIGIGSLFIFGLNALHSENGTIHSCVASITEGASCPSENNLLSFVNFHLKAVKKTSLAVVSFLLSLIAAVFAFYLRRFSGPLAEAVSWTVRPVFCNTTKDLAVRRWLALHENSPNPLA